MTDCIHTICRYARSEELIRDLLADRIRKSEIADAILSAHFGRVKCRMPETAYPKILNLPL